jgi:hypothetical protein
MIVAEPQTPEGKPEEPSAGDPEIGEPSRDAAEGSKQDPDRAESRFRMAAMGCFLLALVLRVYFVREVQPPGQAIISDMQRYLALAKDLLLGQPVPPLTAVCKPPGATWFFALQMKLFGLEAYPTMALVQALLGASAPVFIMLAAKRVFRSERLVGPLSVGLATALWPPLFVYTGYFSTEVPYAFLLTLSLWLWIRFLQTGKGALAAGLVTALAYPLRPQIALTVALVVVYGLVTHEERVWLGVRKAALVLAPMALVVVLCAARYHRITGEWGLISNNNVVMSFFASTNYQGVHTTLAPAPESGPTAVGFQPPPRTASEGFEDPFRTKGAYCDPEPLRAEKARILAKTSLFGRLRRVGRNITYLSYRNSLWPEAGRAKSGLRAAALVVGRYAGSYLLVPLALAAIALLAFRKNLGVTLSALHVLALLYTAAFYFGELRYRVPYDPILILLAVYALLVALKVEPKAEGEAPKPWVKYAILAGLAGLVLLELAVWVA